MEIVDIPAPVPAEPAHVALYHQHIGREVQSKSAAEEACNALASPTSSPLVKATLQGVLAKPVQKKALATVRMLEQMVVDAKQSGTLAGFLRFRELIEIRTDDISIKDDATVIKIPYSKTDQIRKGDEVIIARSGKETCPVTYLDLHIIARS